MIRSSAIIVFFLLIFVGCERNQEQTKKFPFLAWGFSVDGFPITPHQLEQLEIETKIEAKIIQFYLQWPLIGYFVDSLLPTLEAISNISAIPSMTWEPMSIVDQKEQAIPYEKILNGDYDDYLNQMANEIKSWGKPMIIRLAHEMNLKRYHWGTTEDQYGPNSPEIYIKMFRYIVTRFQNLQVHNALWAFCPNVDSDPTQSWNLIKDYYPGDEYVDIFGMDGYNWAITPEISQVKQMSWSKPWISFEQLFHELYHQLKTISPNKPILVFETSSVNRDGHKKSEWIKEALQVAIKWDLMGIIWFQSNKEEDWRIQQDEDFSYLPYIRMATSPNAKTVTDNK